MTDEQRARSTGEDELQDLFLRYAAACPEVEPGSNFMPQLWEKIEQRGSLWFFFARLGRPLAAGAAALCLLLALLNLGSRHASNVLSYPDALVAAHSAEKTYFAEGIRSSLPGEDRAAEDAH
ncbi:MAG TPA: hypothetical protein VH351_00340 [Bryobacteraceae bacterium]|jgi:hypothetical protein|nr:hypothetical protein [Bryobacteraceae bacterium]